MIRKCNISWHLLMSLITLSKRKLMLAQCFGNQFEFDFRITKQGALFVVILAGEDKACHYLFLDIVL